MSINLQKISDAINAKISSFGSSSPTSELVKIIESINNVNAHGGVITASSKNALPLADSSNTGTIAFVRSTGYTDSAGTFYFGTGTDWSMLTTASDSADSAGAATVVEDTGSSFSLQGSTYAYSASNAGHPSFPGHNAAIDKYAFAGGSNATDAGDLTVARTMFAGQASASDYGYALGGFNPNGPQADAKTRIDRFPFASDGDATDVGTLTVQTYDGVNGNVQTADHGYIGKTYDFPTSPGSAYYKYSFSSSISLSGGGTFTASNYTNYFASSGNSSTTHGYINAGSVYPVSGGFQPSNMIEKFPFASEGDTTDVGDLTVGRYRQVGINSTTHGYTAGGKTPSASNVIDKFPFASDGNATDVGDLLSGWHRGGGAAETAAGYILGGYGTPYHNYKTVIQSFPFASDANSTNTNDTLITGGFYTKGFQV
jgi:hypothetical protein